MQKEIPTKYDPQSVEKRIYEKWLEEHVFSASVDKSKNPFCIVIPPPNVTGVLHMGHALDGSIQDLLTRWHRMKGDSSLWLPGMDHAGIATQNVVEKRIADEGLSRHDMGKKAFLERVWQVKEEHQKHMRAQLCRKGASLDWERERFTLDDKYCVAVREAFVQLYDEGLIYQGARMVNWCPRCATSLSDLEVEHQDENGHLWLIRYPGDDGGPGVVVATTRPETMLGDSAVTVHPDDERYKDIVGKNVLLPLMDREIPVVADEYVEMDFGTGALKVTPAHDPNDLEIGMRHNLESIVVIGEDGRMTEAAGGYAGLERYEARAKIVADLEALGLLEGVEDHSHAVGHCSRCKTTVEPLVSKQWFVGMKPLVKEALQVVYDGDIKFIPERWGRVYCDWLENIQDWCISRQLWWGHPIPVWHCGDCGEMTCTKEDPTECAHCGSSNIEADPDVLDTWFSSAMWPFATLGWPEKTESLEYFYPTSVLVTGYDIIYFWVARMVIMGCHFTKQIPFNTVFIHGLVRDEKGRKISKSLGNNIDPIDLMETYSADAVRFSLVQLITHGQDLKYSEDRILAARNFANKLWNASRFVMMNLDEDMEPVDLANVELSLADRWILSRHAAMVAAVNTELENFNLAQAADMLWEHIWREFCDWYVELSKPDLYGDSTSERKATVQTILRQMLSGILRALHPFMPFVTEEIWQLLEPEGGSIVVAAYPVASEDARDENAEASMNIMQEVVSTTRNLRAVIGIPPSQKVKVTLQADGEVPAMLCEQERGLKALAGVNELCIEADGEAPENVLGGLAAGVKVFLHIEGGIDLAEEAKRLENEIQKVAKLNAQCEKKLGNEGFVSRAPAEVIERERERLEENSAALAKLQEQLDVIRGLLG